jgi:hypothetical protein
MQEDKQGDHDQPECTPAGNLEGVKTVGLLGLLAPGFVRIQIDTGRSVRGRRAYRESLQ